MSEQTQEHVDTHMILISDILITKRLRKELGDMDELAESINERGLINPITVMECSDGKYQLLAGLRRMEASKLLGGIEIRATVLSPMDADAQLMLEIAENEQRKEFTVAERLEYVEQIRGIEREKAKQRMSDMARIGREDGREDQGTGKCPYPSGERGESRSIIAEKAGFTSSRQMRRAQHIAYHRPDLLPAIHNGSTTISAAYNETIGGSKPAYTPDAALAGAPTRPGAKPRLIQSLNTPAKPIVTTEEIDTPPIEIIHPSTITLLGAPDTIQGADHDALMDNPVYAFLFARYTEAVQSANVTIGNLRFRCENYEKRIRAYEENQRTMERTIEGLRTQADYGMEASENEQI